MTETRVEVVVTVPEELPRDLLVPTAMRTTLGVLVDLIANSQRHVILASPFFQLASTLTFGPLGLALHAAILRNVLIDIVSTSGSFSSLDLSQLSPTRVPTSIRLSQPKANLIDSEVLGSHAKLCLVDHKVV